MQMQMIWRKMFLMHAYQSWTQSLQLRVHEFLYFPCIGTYVLGITMQANTQLGHIYIIASV